MNKRIMKIVDVLLKQDSYITIDKISEELAVSNKTIRNDLQIVDQYLEENHLRLIKKTGVGIRIEGSVNDKLHILESAAFCLPCHNSQGYPVAYQGSGNL